MNKKYNLALFALAFLTFCSNFASNVFAQKTDAPKSEQSNGQQCSGEKFVMPPSIAVGGAAFTTFIKVMSLPSGARQKAFSDLPNEGKADVFKVRLALNFITRPNLTREQKDLILESLSLISADTYDKANPEKAAKTARQVIELENKALGIFPRNEAYQIFADMNGDTKADVALLQKYEDVVSLSTMGKRRQAFRELSPTEKSNLWKSQMIYYLVTSKFNKAQQDFILEVISLSTPRAFTFPPNQDIARNDETKALDALEEKAFRLFSKVEVAAFFMSFGIHKIPTPSQQDLAPNPKSCDCNWFCVPCEGCHALTGCIKSTEGCGWSGGSECTKECRLLQNCP